jgi:RNA polymerase sigma-70 factor (ECF subfamily)
VLRYVADLDYAEIAESLDLPLGTVKSRIARGRAALAELLVAGNQTAGNQTDPTERPTPAP